MPQSHIRKKRAKIGKCNICQEELPLSWDHVPPKSSIDLTPVEIKTVFNVLTRGKPQVRESQNGVKFRTICSECNSFIGSKYDPVIRDFSLSVGRYLSSGLSFPAKVSHRAKPILLMRGILAHLLAAKETFEETKFDQQVRGFLFDHEKPIHDDIFIHYWLHPHVNTVVMRDFAMPSVRGKFQKFDVFQTLKFFPMAYLVSGNPSYEGLLELTKYRTLGIDDEVEIPILLNRIENPNWPEIVDEKNMVMVGKSIASSISSTPRIQKGKK